MVPGTPVKIVQLQRSSFAIESETGLTGIHRGLTGVVTAEVTGGFEVVLDRAGERLRLQQCEVTAIPRWQRIAGWERRMN